MLSLFLFLFLKVGPTLGRKCKVSSKKFQGSAVRSVMCDSHQYCGQRRNTYLLQLSKPERQQALELKQS